jgi:hypothetical protein
MHFLITLRDSDPTITMGTREGVRGHLGIHMNIYFPLWDLNSGSHACWASATTYILRLTLEDTTALPTS